LNCDNTVYPVVLFSSYFWPGSTVTMTGLTRVFPSGKSAWASEIDPLEIWDKPYAATSSPSMALPVHADNAAALTAGLVEGQLYVTSTGVVMRVYTP
jgi:hypothetical protein